MDQAPEALSEISQLLTGGEALSVPHVRLALSRSPSTEIINGYGPTEGTTFTCCYRIPRQLDETINSIPIGCPIGNSKVYILDSHLTPVPIGVPGELHIGGDGLARGYLNRPDLTAEKFIPDPFSSEPGARLYKSGDLARYRADGNIEFLGRNDDQVKIRGFRIEPGEIETVLRQHPAVRHAVVLAREDDPGEASPSLSTAPSMPLRTGKRLVAYVVAKQDPAPTSDELRNFLKRQLPDYMIPPAVVNLRELPLSSNGKVNRNALPEPERRSEQAGVFVAPRTATEKILARVWARVLRLDRVGIHDNFFSLGGHSLLAVRLAREIERALNKRLPIAMLFQFPTVEQLADAVSTRKLPERSSLVTVRATGSKPPFFFVHGEHAYAHFAIPLDADRPFYGLAQHREGRTIRHTQIEDIAAYYVTKVRAVQTEGPYFIGGHSLGALIAFEMAQQLHKQGQQIALLALLEPAAAEHSGAAADEKAGRTRVRPPALNISAPPVKAMLKHFLKSLKSHTRTIICELYQLFNKTLPPKLEKFYLRKIVFSKIYKQAVRNYRPKTYPGRVVYFKARGNSRNSAATWQRLAQGGVEVHHVSGDHASMLLPPHARELARELAACLSKAQAGDYISPDAEAAHPRNDRQRNQGPHDHSGGESYEPAGLL
jgi:thioesterase domain-containing protein/acyl carrier protein